MWTHGTDGASKSIMGHRLYHVLTYIYSFWLIKTCGHWNVSIKLPCVSVWLLPRDLFIFLLRNSSSFSYYWLPYHILTKKEKLTRGERSDTYLTHVCRLLQSVECLEINRKKTGAFAQHCGFHQLWRAIESWWKPQCWQKASVFFLFSQDTLYFAPVCRHQSGRYWSFLPYLVIVFVFTILGFLLMLLLYVKRCRKRS